MSIMIKGRVIANSAAVLLARVQTATGAYLLPTDVTSITVSVIDQYTGTILSVLTGTPAVVYSSLQLDARWAEDAVGYNVAVTVPGTAWTTAGKYRVEAKVTPTSGTPFYLLWDLQATITYS
jgi:hypothetical protein